MRNQNPNAGLAPIDLRDSVDEPMLIQLALNSVQTLDWSSDRLKSQQTNPQRPQMMMTLLTYCYSVGLLGSWDVEWATRNDPAARYICAHSFPDAKAIRSFRRRNRASLRQTLAFMLQQAWAWRLDQGEEDYPGYAWIETVLATRIATCAANKLDSASLLDETFFEN